MAIQTLYRAGAYGSGADLWVLPDLSVSHWARSIDWHLNYQISKAKLHLTKNLSEELQDMVQVGLIEPTVIKVDGPSPLMVASPHRLPNKQVVVLPEITHHKDWLNLAFQVWTQLARPSLRIFLPPEFELSEFQKLWPGSTESHDLTLVPAAPQSHL